MLQRPKVATVVLSYQDPSDTLRAVRSVQDGRYLDNVVIVVDNDEDTGRQAHLAGALDPAVRYLAMGSNVGYAAGNNAGIRLAVGDYDVRYVWVLNPDAVAEPDSLSRLVATADALPEAALVGSRLVRPDGSGKVLFNGADVEAETGLTAQRDSGKRESRLPATGPFDSGYAHGASMLIRADVLPVIGYIPEDYFLYFEETDYAQRALARGYRVVVEPRSRVRHERRSWGDLPTSAYIYYMIRNRAIFSARWGFPRHAEVTDVFAGGWRRKIGQNRPELLPAFEKLIDAARADGAAGVTGRSPLPEQVVLR